MEYTHECLLDDFPKDSTMNDIYMALTCVGFSSPPSWLKPYDVLSNGEKMRCDLARALCEKKDLIVFDEFTSVVDRTVAKVGSLAMQKAIRKKDKKFIAVTCHHDVQEWLMPDWVLNTDTMTFHTFSYEEQKKNRPTIKLEIYETKRKAEYWKIFKNYHYLSHSFNVAARTFVCFCNGELCGFYSVLPFPHPRVKNYVRGHRAVILPDYQGIGIGTAFTDFIAQLFKKEGKILCATTSSPAMIAIRKKSKKWICIHIGRQSRGSTTGAINKIGTSSRARMTASFRYVGE